MTRPKTTTGFDLDLITRVAAIGGMTFADWQIIENPIVPPDRVYALLHVGRMYVHNVDDFRWRLFLGQQWQDARDAYDDLLIRTFGLQLVLDAGVGYNIVAADS